MSQETIKISDENEETLENQAVILYEHTKELAQLKYESELRREDSIIQQSSQMQTAFSFMTASVFMAAPIMIEHRGDLTLKFFLVSFSLIVFFLLISLVAASHAQKRKKHHGLMDILDIEKFVSKNWETSLKKSEQLKQWVEVIGKIQKDTARINDERIRSIIISRWSFYASIASIVISFTLGLIKLQ